MEDNRFFIMLVLILLFSILYFSFFSHTQPQKPTASAPATRIEPKPPETPSSEEKHPTPVSLKPTEIKPSQRSVLRNLQMEAVLQSRNADICSLALIEKKDGHFIYPEREKKDAPLKLLDEPLNSSSLRLLDKEEKTVFEGGWEVKQSNSSSVEFVAEDEILNISKKIKIADDGYHLVLNLDFKNKTSNEISIEGLKLLIASSIERERESKGNDYLLIARKNEGVLYLSEVHLDKSEKNKPYKDEAPFEFCGISNHYFAVLLRPDDTTTERCIAGAMLEKLTDKEEVSEAALAYAVSALLRPIKIPPDSTVTLNFIVFAGPKSPELLEEKYSKYGFEKIISYGFFGFLSSLFLAILQGIHFLIPNWGVAIIILTFIVRGALHPISRKQQTSMFNYQQKMQVIQPEIERLKKKYANEKQKLNQEILKLMRKHGVPLFPAGGCLLMFLQIPVFIGLWQALNTSIHIRQARFCLWINDLSQPDRLFKLPFSIPILSTPYINLLPILMIITMLIQSRFQPKTAQAQQQKMMNYFMYAFLTLIFYSLPSGLVLYFLASTLIGIAESYIIRKHMKQLQQPTKI